MSALTANERARLHRRVALLERFGRLARPELLRLRLAALGEPSSDHTRALARDLLACPLRPHRPAAEPADALRFDVSF